jgi:branched-chain amino acid transport system substrate-binding protein
VSTADSEENLSQISRRQFMKIAGVAAGGIALGSTLGLAACASNAETTTTGAGSTASTAATGSTAAAGSTGSSGPSAQTSEPIRIGTTLPLTGFAAADGLEAKEAMAMVIDEWNARGGVLGRQIEQTILDCGEFAPETVTTQFRQLGEQYKVHAIVNSYLIFNGAEYPVVAELNIPHLNLNTSSVTWDQFKKEPDKYYMAFQADAAEVYYAYGFPPFIQDLIDRGLFVPKNKKIAIISGSDAYGVQIADTLTDTMTKVGWTVSLREKYVSPNNDWTAILKKIRDDPPDVIFFSTGVLPDQASFTKQFAENPTPSLIYEQSTPSNPEYIKLVGDAGNGIIWGTVVGELVHTPLADQYDAAYTAKYNKVSGRQIGPLNYDIMSLYLTAVALAGGTDVKKVSDALSRIYYKGICGTMTFTKDGHVVPSYPADVKDPASGQPQLYFQIQNGESKLIAPAVYAETAYVKPAWI